MSPIEVGSLAPPVPGVPFGDGPRALVFYKVTCPVCQMAASKVATLDRAFPGTVVGVGQDPGEELEEFTSEFDFGARSVADVAPYEASDAYGIETVPTLVLVNEEGVIADVVPAWDRDGYNRVAAELAEYTGQRMVVISSEGDGLPPYRPG